MGKRKVHNVSEVIKSKPAFEKITLTCDSCGSSLKIDKITNMGIICSCPKCETPAVVTLTVDGINEALIKTLEEQSRRAQQINPELANVSFESLDDGTRETSEIKKDEVPDLTVGEAFGLSLTSLAISGGLVWLADKLKHLWWDCKGNVFLLLAYLAYIGVAITGLFGLYVMFNKDDGAIVSLIRAKKNNQENQDEDSLVYEQSESVENDKPKHMNLGR